jgi:hypothetical protein
VPVFIIKVAPPLQSRQRRNRSAWASVVTRSRCARLDVTGGFVRSNHEPPTESGRQQVPAGNFETEESNADARRDRQFV